MTSLPRTRRWTAAALPMALFAALATGCASTHGLAPSGAPADADALSARLTLGDAVSDQATFPRQDWWTALGDPQLDALINEALRGTPSLDVADARMRQAQAQAGLADAARKPSLSASAQYAGLRIPETLAPEPLGGDYTGVGIVGLNFKHSFDLWGGHRAKWEAAIGQARAAEVDAQAARLTLSAQIGSAYVGLAQAFDAQDVAKAEQARAQHLLALGKQRVAAGLDNQTQVRVAESAIATARQQEEAASHQIETQRHALAALLGQGPDRGLSIARPTLLKTPAPAVPALMSSELLGHRPDVVAARWRVDAAQHGIKASKAEFYPTINLSAMVGLAAGNLGDLFSSNALLLQGGPAISLPIFDGGRLRSQLARSDADYDLAVAQYNGSLSTALREVADAVASARSLDAQIADVTVARDAAQQAWTLAGTRYRAGLGTQLDVLAAQRPLLQADQQLAALRAQRALAAIELNRALGGGLPLTAPASATDATASASTTSAP
ncbi:efflux transporter outer membrane subunit [Aerolutibacter ruishenii]|uniref:NodT family efflux transporter outer membrane factor (OMF) lipoprotein n=1 Tax=Aerolutibacter ruishenii TaxID=686800 RepID=A0A562LI26_9GAMM|nr:efflux transporter outer membrane subunit [Lysobacter ruishenii]TWI07226.1 NodT family efflux transporter outer membrane factor (OMF) lipoprotein [Lysobacter ruishenii]